MLSVLLALMQRLLMCCVYVCCVSRVMPRILFVLVVVSGVLLMLIVSWVLCSLGSGVESDICVLAGFMCRLFCAVHEVMLLMAGWRLFEAVRMSVCVEVIVMSSAYVWTLTRGVLGRGMSAVYMLKRVGERTLPCGTPKRVILMLDRVLLYVVYACLPLV